MTTTSRSWPDQLAAQLRWHWDHQLRARLAGMTDEEYFWEPVADCWSGSTGAGQTASRR